MLGTNIAQGLVAFTPGIKATSVPPVLVTAQLFAELLRYPLLIKEGVFIEQLVLTPVAAVSLLDIVTTP